MTQQPASLSILHLEDSETDAILIAHYIAEDLPGCRIEHIATPAAYRAALQRGGIDVILSDYRMPGYDGDQALTLARTLSPDVPFIMVTGELGEDRAIETVKRGATDYVLKDNLKRLVPSIRRALEEAAAVRQRKDAEAKLHQTVEELRAASMELEARAEELRAQQERLKFHVENSPLAVVEWSADFVVTRWSKEAERLFGWNAVDIIGKRIDTLNMVYTGDMPIVQRTMERLVSGLERVVVSTNRNYTRDGGVVECTWYNSILLDEQGNMSSVMSLVLDLTERRHTEEALARQSKVLEGIRAILEAALTCPTEEELGRICLAVAESTTGSRFGFVGEINADGLLDSIAISDPGWAACQIPLHGERRPPARFRIRGIYGLVLNQGKPYFTNDPAADPEAVGVPAGHPPLTAFLGVPLVREGITIGMIAVGNRPNGYGPLEQEILEALAPVVVEAFQRKRAADSLLAANEELTRFNRAAVDRELRMIDLKKEVNELCLRLGQPPRYALDFAADEPPATEPAPKPPVSPSAL